MKKLSSLTSRILFLASFIIAFIAVSEKMANLLGYTFTKGYYSNWQLLAFSAIALLFVIALQLREIKTSFAEK